MWTVGKWRPMYEGGVTTDEFIAMAIVALLVWIVVVAYIQAGVAFWVKNFPEETHGGLAWPFLIALWPFQLLRIESSQSESQPQSILEWRKKPKKGPGEAS